MKTTLDLPDEVMRAVKIHAVNENRKLKDMVAELLRRGLAQESGGGEAIRHRVSFPLVDCERARPEAEMTPDRLAQVLIDEEARRLAGPHQQRGLGRLHGLPD